MVLTEVARKERDHVGGDSVDDDLMVYERGSNLSKWIESGIESHWITMRSRVPFTRRTGRPLSRKPSRESGGCLYELSHGLAIATVYSHPAVLVGKIRELPQGPREVCFPLPGYSIRSIEVNPH